MQFVVATANRHKLQEIKEILAPYSIELAPPPADVPAVAETGQTYEENAVIKAAAVAKQFQRPAIADDSGLEIDALNGAPGLYSSRYLGEEKSYDVKNRHILDAMKNIPPEKRKARFVCAAAIAYPDGTSKAIRGTVEGIIADSMHGNQGFGYDPIFFLPQLGKTMAELTPEEKNRISHRSQAFRLLMGTLPVNDR